MNKCKCGCGEDIIQKSKYRIAKYIRGHNTRGQIRPPRSKEWCEKLSISLSGRIGGMTDKKHSQDTKQFMVYINIGDKNPNWKGGCKDTLHKQAWELFGKTYCELCGMHLLFYLNLTGIRFDMHNTLNPKDYTVMEQYAWMCLCNKCHKEIDNRWVN